MTIKKRNGRKYIELEIAEDGIDFFGAVLTCAVRYCIGRETYMPLLVTDWIMEHCDGLLNEKALGVMMRDIDEAAARNGLGMDCDIATWAMFRAWLVNQNSTTKKSE